ncbi:protein-tyrosine phosphatase family protein [Megalodesulfovibrio paquesii]
MARRESPFVWVSDQLAVGAAPLSYAQLARLHDEGVSAILNLCGEFCDLHEIERDHGFEVHYLPIPDEEAPDMAALEAALAWLDEAIYLGKRVYIHCRHGIGRTGTVLNAYLLRRGLGHKMADRILAKLRSKPTNFCQWRAVKRYGKAAGKLTIREPRLEFKRLVDLHPFIHDYEELAIEVEQSIADACTTLPRCGREHSRCCTRPVQLTFIEAVDLATMINEELTSETRQALMERANQASRHERQIRQQSQETRAAQGESCLADMDFACPLLEHGRCMLFYMRPLQCRTYGMPAEVAESLWQRISPALNRLSGQAFLALSGSFLPDAPLAFSIAEVVSGRYVQRFFHQLRLAAQ